MSNKRRRAPATIQFGPEFLQALAPEVHLRLTSGALKSLQSCQEEFISQLVLRLQKEITGETSDASDEEEESGENPPRQLQLQQYHIEAAMTQLGLSGILEEAKRHQQIQQDKDDAKRRKKPPKNQKFTAEMEAEQERLLQMSKQNALQMKQQQQQSTG